MRIQTATESPTGSPRKLLSRVERQESILRGAAAAFAHTGFDGTSMEDVADASGITRLIVYRNFASKEDLYRAVLERVMVRLARRVPRRLRAIDRPRLRRSGVARRGPRRPRWLPPALGARRPRTPIRGLRSGVSRASRRDRGRVHRPDARRTRRFAVGRRSPSSTISTTRCSRGSTSVIRRATTSSSR